MLWTVSHDGNQLRRLWRLGEAGWETLQTIDDIRCQDDAQDEDDHPELTTTTMPATGRSTARGSVGSVSLSRDSPRLMLCRESLTLIQVHTSKGRREERGEKKNLSLLHNVS